MLSLRHQITIRSDVPRLRVIGAAWSRPTRLLITAIGLIVNKRSRVVAAAMIIMLAAVLGR